MRSAPAHPDQLPPHNVEAEQGVLGCLFLNPAKVAEAEKAFQNANPFYDLRHQLIYEAVCWCYGQHNGAVDLILVQERLRSLQRLEEIGGLAYVASLTENVPSAENLPYYAQAVWEKYLARKLIRSGVEAAAMAQTGASGILPVLSRLKMEVENIERAAIQQGSVVPPRFKTLDHYAEEYWNAWFGENADEPGLALPFEFPFKVRTGESTLMVAENGAGKTTLMAYIGIHLLRHPGQKLLVASMEMRPEITLKIMAAQLLGTRKLAENDANSKRVMDAYGWLRARVAVYDFLGIADWRDLLFTFEYAAQAGYTLFQVDSLMRLGISDDDYAEQGNAARSFCHFATARKAHVFLVNHLNKSEGDVKRKSRGSMQWADNVNNMISIHRNQEKQKDVDELKQFRDTGRIDQAEYEAKMQPLRIKHDCYFDLHKQRWPGSRQNGRRYLYFNSDGLQYHEEPQRPTTPWLEHWKER